MHSLFEFVQFQPSLREKGLSSSLCDLRLHLLSPACSVGVKKMAEEDLGTAYAGQEDINEKLLLDLAWERQQKKVGKGKRVCVCARHVRCKLPIWRPVV